MRRADDAARDMRWGLSMWATYRSARQVEAQCILERALYGQTAHPWDYPSPGGGRSRAGLLEAIDPMKCVERRSDSSTRPSLVSNYSGRFLPRALRIRGRVTLIRERALPYGSSRGRGGRRTKAGERGRASGSRSSPGRASPRGPAAEGAR
eukprot:scaffold1100_cov323-Prasinococcus_capsulatus_cf.AAC.4